MPFDGLSLFSVTESSNIKPFDCGDDDLNDFLASKAKNFHKEILSVTHIIENPSKTVAYFSLFNDALDIQEEQFASKSAFKRYLSEIFPFGKRHLRRLPAIKIGRLAVCKDEKGNDIGTDIINYVIDVALTQNISSACKLITVDAYDISLGFYEKMGFVYLSDNDMGQDTRQMYLDLEPFIRAVVE